MERYVLALWRYAEDAANVEDSDDLDRFYKREDS